MNESKARVIDPDVRRAVTMVANLVLWGIALVFTVGLLWAAAKSDVYPPGSMHPYYLTFGIAVGLCLLALRLRPDRRSKTALLALSALLTLYLFESGLAALASPGNPHAIAARAMGADFDSRSKAELFRTLEIQGHSASPLAPPIFFASTDGLATRRGDQLYSLGNISKSVIVNCNETGVFSTFESDEHGFNNPIGTFSAERTEIALIGDSFGVGSCVAPNEDLGSQLRSFGWQIVNLSNASDGPLLELATLTEYASSLRPDVVLWTYFEGNDPSDLLREQASPILVQYLEDGFTQSLLARQDEIDETLTTFIQGRVSGPAPKGLGSVLFSIAKLTAVRNLFGFVLPPLVLSPMFGQVMAEAAERTAAWGGKFYVVYLPDWRRYGGAVRGNLVHREQVLSIFEDLEIQVIDLHPVFAAHPDPLSLFPFRTRGHYSQEGYALVATTLADHLETLRP